MGKQMTGADLQSKHRRTYLDFRRQNYIISTEAFEDAYDSGTKEQKILLESFLTAPNPDLLRSTIIDIMLGGTLTMPTLKKIAQKYQILNYSRMTKFELEDELLSLGVKL